MDRDKKSACAKPLKAKARRWNGAKGKGSQYLRSYGRVIQKAEGRSQRPAFQVTVKDPSDDPLQSCTPAGRETPWWSDQVT